MHHTTIQKPLVEHPGTFYRTDSRRMPSTVVAHNSSSSTPPSTFSDVHPNPMVQTTSKLNLLIGAPSMIKVAAAMSTIAAVGVAWRVWKKWKREQQMEEDDTLIKKKRNSSDGSAEMLIEGPLSQQQKRSFWQYFFGSNDTANAPMTPPTAPSSSSTVTKRKKRTTPSSPSLRRSRSNNSISSDTSQPHYAASPLQRISSSNAFLQFMEEVKLLALEGVIIPYPTEFFAKRERMRTSNMKAMKTSRNGRDSNLHILCSFDRTMTTLFQQHQQTPTILDPAMVIPESSAGATVSSSTPSIALTTNSLLHSFLPSSYATSLNALYRQYSPTETSPHIDAHTKDAYMREWWTRAHALLCLDEYRLTRNKLTHMIQTSLSRGHISLRDGVFDLLRQDGMGLCDAYDIHCLIVSGSIHDSIEEMLKQHEIRVWNTNGDSQYQTEGERNQIEASKIMLVANRINWSVPPQQQQQQSQPPSKLTSPLTPSSKLASESSSLSSSSSSASASSAASNFRRKTSTLTNTASICLSFDTTRVVHSLNKPFAVNTHPYILSRLASEGKVNIILIGSTLSDAELSQGIEQARREAQYAAEAWQGHYYQQQQQQQQIGVDSNYPSASSPSPLPSSSAAASSIFSPEILRIGYLNSDVTPQRIEEFSRVYDLILTGDGDFVRVNRLIKYICGEDVTMRGDVIPQVQVTPQYLPTQHPTKSSSRRSSSRR